jgi:hypothetical protein
VGDAQGMFGGARALCAVALCGCAHQAPAPAVITVAAPAVNPAADAPFVLRWTETQQFDLLPEPRTVEVEESWTPTVEAPPGGVAGTLWEVRTRRGAETAQNARMVTAADGLYRVDDGALLLELPLGAAPGAEWEDHRSCAVQPTPFCAEGVAVACTTVVGARTIWLRQHWCAGGWAGYEAVTTHPTQPTGRYFSRDVTRDGVAQPDAPLSARAVPMPESVEAP